MTALPLDTWDHQLWVGTVLGLGDHPVLCCGVSQTRLLLPRAAVADPGSLAVSNARLDEAWSTLG